MFNLALCNKLDTFNLKTKCYEDFFYEWSKVKHDHFLDLGAHNNVYFTALKLVNFDQIKTQFRKIIINLNFIYL